MVGSLADLRLEQVSLRTAEQIPEQLVVVSIMCCKGELEFQLVGQLVMVRMRPGRGYAVLGDGPDAHDSPWQPQEPEGFSRGTEKTKDREARKRGKGREESKCRYVAA